MIPSQMMSTFMAYSTPYSQPVAQPHNVYPAALSHAHRPLPNPDTMQDHHGRRSQVVFRNTYRAPAIHFFSNRDDDDGVGVAFPRCIEFYETDVQNSNRSILDVLPPHMHPMLLNPQRPHYLHIHVRESSFRAEAPSECNVYSGKVTSTCNGNTRSLSGIYTTNLTRSERWHTRSRPSGNDSLMFVFLGSALTT